MLLTGHGLCPGGTNLITDLPAQQWLSADAGAAPGLPQAWQWEKEQGQSCTALCRALVLVGQPSLCLSLPSPRAGLANLQRLSESQETHLVTGSQQSLCKWEEKQWVSLLLSSSWWWWVSFPTPEEGQHLVEKTKSRSYTPPRRKVIADSRWADCTRSARVTGRKWGQRQKCKWHGLAARRKRNSPKGICIGLKPWSVNMGRMAFSGNLAIPNSLQGAEIHAGLLCQGRTRRKSGCCQTPYHKQPWRGGGTFISMRQVSNKFWVWHIYGTPSWGLHIPPAKPLGNCPAHQSTLATSDPLRLAALVICSAVLQEYKQPGTRSSKASLCSTSKPT